MGKESNAKKYQLHIPRKCCNSNPEVHERSHIAGLSLPPMHLPKASPKKQRKYAWVLTKIDPWESPQQAVTDRAHKKHEHSPRPILVPYARLMSRKLGWGVLGRY